MNVPIIYRFRGPLDLDALAIAVSSLVKRHECLRTGFVWTESEGQLPEVEQIVYAAAPVKIEPVNVSRGAYSYAAAYTSIHERLQENMDLASGRPFTVDLFRLAPDDHLFMLNVHHLATDGWSNMLLRRELSEYYNMPQSAQLEPVQWTFRDYVEWQRERLEGPVGASHEAFWRTELARARFSDLRPAPVRDSGRMPKAARNVRFEISYSDIEALRAMAARERTTLFVVMLSLFSSTLHLASSGDNIAVGLVLANRPRRELFRTVGPFANFAVLAAQWPADPCFTDVLTAVRRSMLEVLAHQEYPYLSMLNDPAMSSSASRAAEIVFNMLALPTKVAPSGTEFSGLSAEALPIPPGMGSRFDLELMIAPEADRFYGDFRYAPDRYDRTFIGGLAERYTRLIRHVLDHPTAPFAAVTDTKGRCNTAGI